MIKFTKTNIEEIRNVRQAVAALARMQDRLYRQLIEDIGFNKYPELENHLFDLVYNPSDNLDKDIAVLEQRTHKYAEA